MRRIVAPALLLAAAAAGFGCQHRNSHIGGMNDVYHHPDNAVINTGNGNPYHANPVPITGPAVPEKMPAPLPVEEKKDEKKKETE